MGAVIIWSTNLAKYYFEVHGVISTPSAATTPVRGGTWTDDFLLDPFSLIPNGDSSGTWSGNVDQALYLPLFYGDAQGLIQPGAATEVPSVISFVTRSNSVETGGCDFAATVSSARSIA